jgi:hypothetical protein
MVQPTLSIHNSDGWTMDGLLVAYLYIVYVPNAAHIACSVVENTNSCFADWLMVLMTFISPAGTTATVLKGSHAKNALDQLLPSRGIIVRARHNNNKCR